MMNGPYLKMISAKSDFGKISRIFLKKIREKIPDKVL